MLVRHFVRSSPPVVRLVDAFVDPSLYGALASLAAVRLRNRRVGTLADGVARWIREERIPRRHRAGVEAVVIGWEDRGLARTGSDGFVEWDSDDPFASSRAAGWRSLVDRAARRLGSSFDQRLAAARAVADFCSAFAVHEGSDERGTWTSFTVHCRDLERFGEDRREWLLTTPDGWVGTTWRRINFLGDLDEWLVVGARDHALEQLRELVAVEGAVRTRLETSGGCRFDAAAVEDALPTILEAAGMLVVATSRVASRIHPEAFRTVRDFHAFGHLTAGGRPCFRPERSGPMGAMDSAPGPENLLDWLSYQGEERVRRLCQASALFPNCVPDLVEHADGIAAGASVPELLAPALIGSSPGSPDDARTVAQVARRMGAYRDVLAAEAGQLDDPIRSSARFDRVFHPLAVLVRTAGDDAILDQEGDEGRRRILLLARALVPLVLSDRKKGLPAGKPDNFGAAVRREPSRVVDLVGEGVFDMVRAFAETLSDAFGLARLPQLRRERVHAMLLRTLVGRDGGLKTLSEANRVWHRDNLAIHEQAKLLKTNVGSVDPPTGAPSDAVGTGVLVWLTDGPALSAESAEMSHCIRYSLREALHGRCFVASVRAGDGTRSTVKFVRGRTVHADMVPGSGSPELLPVVREHRAHRNEDPSKACHAAVQGFMAEVHAGRIAWTPPVEIMRDDGRYGDVVATWHPGTRPEDVLAVYAGVVGRKLSARTVDEWWRDAATPAQREMRREGE